MKSQIRQGVFETNSSTCHTIAIPKRPTPEHDKIRTWDVFGWYDEKFCFNRGLLTWVENVGEKIAFSFMLILYKFSHRMTSKKYGGEGKTYKELKPDVAAWKTMIINWTEEEADDEDRGDILDYVKDLLDFLEEEILIGKSSIDKFGKSAWIDHPEELMDFVKSIEQDPELLKKFIFDEEAYATVCGDEYRGAYVKKVGFEEDYPYSCNKEDGEATFGDRIRELKQDWDFWMSDDPE